MRQGRPLNVEGRSCPRLCKKADTHVRRCGSLYCGEPVVFFQFQKDSVECLLRHGTANAVATFWVCSVNRCSDSSKRSKYR